MFQYEFVAIHRSQILNESILKQKVCASRSNNDFYQWVEEINYLED